MILRIRTDAEADLEGAFDWYESRRRGLGLELLNEYRHALRAIAEAPHRWPEHPKQTDLKRHRLRRFPYALAYRVESDHCMIFAVEDLRRRPGYWRQRLNQP